MRKCGKDSCDARVSIAVEDISKERFKGLKEDFEKNILSVMRDDHIGKTAKSDPTILMIGSMMFERIKRRAKKKRDSKS